MEDRRAVGASRRQAYDRTRLRTFAVGLPVLDMFLNTNGTAYASGAPLPTRFGTYFWGLGLTDTPTGGTRWVPTKVGAGYEVMPELEAIAGVKDKVSCFAAFARRHGVTLAECAFLGDDLPDVAVMRAVGYPMAVADAHPLVLGIASWVAPSAGGHGAAREALEHLLEARGLWAQVLERYGAADLADVALPAAGSRA